VLIAVVLISNAPFHFDGTAVFELIGTIHRQS